MNIVDLKQNNIKKFDYIPITDSLSDPSTDNRYDSPPSSTLHQMRDVWGLITNLNLPIRMVRKDDCKNLAQDSDDLMKFFQPRANTTLSGEVNYYEQFYILEKRRIDIPVATKIDGKLYMIVGWKRARAHEYAIKIEEMDSRFDYIEILFPEDWDRSNILATCNKLARLGNKRRDSIREESAADYPHQLETAYELECMSNRNAKIWTDEQRLEWARQWVIDEISDDYAHENMTRQLGNIVNHAFAPHRGQSLPFPSNEEINLNAKRFWPHVNFLKESSNVIKATCSGRIDKITEKLDNHWKRDFPPSKARTPAYLALRVGQRLDAEITSTKTVDEQIKRVLKNITNHNTNAAVIFAGMPLPEKLLFVKQMNKGDYRAYEWDHDSQEYIIVEER